MPPRNDATKAVHSPNAELLNKNCFVAISAVHTGGAFSVTLTLMPPPIVADETAKESRNWQVTSDVDGSEISAIAIPVITLQCAFVVSPETVIFAACIIG